jgi:hypothetical protein
MRANIIAPPIAPNEPASRKGLVRLLDLLDFFLVSSRLKVNKGLQIARASSV